jgi:hypothetical protein
MPNLKIMTLASPAFRGVVMTATPIRRQVQLCVGKAAPPVGSLVYVRQGRRENSAFAYDEGWLDSPARFNVSEWPNLMTGGKGCSIFEVH